MCVAVARSCIHNAHNALCNRHGAASGLVTADVHEAFDDFAEVIGTVVHQYHSEPLLNRALWFATWPLNKALAMMRNCDLFAYAPDRVKAMVKREVYHKLNITKARLIQFYWNYATQCLCGPQYTAVQKVLTRAFRRRLMRSGSTITFASGMAPNELADWMTYCLADGVVCFYERDGKNWDSTMGPATARFRARVYAMFDAELARFAESCTNVTGAAYFGDRALLYKLIATVKSGHNDTTLGNNLINAAITYLVFKRLGVRCHILVAGDDLVVACASVVTAPEVMAIEREYGILPEARVFERFEHVSFISSIWVHDGRSMAFIPTPGRLLARLWWTVSPPAEKNLDAYRRGVALGLLGACRNVPIIRVWLSKFDIGVKSLRSDKCYTHKGATNDLEYDGMLDCFARRYGLTREQIEECDRWLVQLPAEPLLIVHPVLMRIVETDLVDIDVRGEYTW
jgi:hypothetical protein